ncbi:MAG: 6-phosphofructokinase [Oscillospiraceae bacterium]|nr:6-phosphofructokinase [Oscillospiraceae bacterium]
MKTVGILTSGGDCPGLNATIRGVAKALYEARPDISIIGIRDGFYGLIHGECEKMKPSDFSEILTRGGTILGTSRQPHKKMQKIEADHIDKIASMKKTYADLKLDCLFILGGNGTHKTANLLRSEGLNIIGLPKTIDNDIFGTDYTFGFHTAVDIATEVIDRIHTTAASHKRVMLIEIMGNKAGWLTLYSGVAGGADIILIPELPFEPDNIAKALEKRERKSRPYTIIAVAEGAMDADEARLKKKERTLMRLERGEATATNRIAAGIHERTGFDTRVVIPGHIVRGGSPSAYDRVLATRFGTYAASLAIKGVFGVAVALKGDMVTHNKLEDIAGIPKLVPPEHQMVAVARETGVIFGDN